MVALFALIKLPSVAVEAAEAAEVADVEEEATTRVVAEGTEMEDIVRLNLSLVLIF